MAFGLSVGVGHSNETLLTEGESLEETFGLKEGTNTTTNSGSTNTGKNTTTGTQTNSGSTNVSTTDGSTNTTDNTATSTTSGGINKSGTNASTNVSVTSGSTSTKTNSGSTNTSQLIISQEGIDNIVKGILEGTQGLANTSKGQNVSGGYNSTTNMMLTNDLLARTAGEVAERTAKRVDVIGGFTETIENSGSKTTTNIGATTGFTEVGGQTTTQTGSSTQNIGGTKSTQQVGGSTSSNQSVTDILNVIGGSTSSTSILEQLTSKTNKTATEEKEKEETKEEAKGGWIVCTELYKQNKMPWRFYSYGSRAFAKYDEQSKKGYYIWAVPAVNHLRKNPNSKLSKFLEVMMNARAEQIAADGGCISAKKSLLGLIAKNLYWGCWILSRTVARNYEVPDSFKANLNPLGD